MEENIGVETVLKNVFGGVRGGSFQYKRVNAQVRNKLINLNARIWLHKSNGFIVWRGEMRNR